MEPMEKTTNQSLSASLEDYLEAIFQIAEAKNAVRSKDISARLNVNKSSVTGALRALTDKGLINYAPYDLITMTERGRAVAEQVSRRHRVFRDFLVTVLGIEEEKAESAACKAEHALSGEVLGRLADFMEFLEQAPGGRGGCLEGFQSFCDSQGKNDGWRK